MTASSSKPQTPTQLSKNVLQMKFMQRSVLRIEREKNEEEQQKTIDDEHWVIDLPEYQTNESKYEKGMGYVFCEELGFGRCSYKGFNAEIEKLMDTVKNEKELTEAEEREKEIGVDDKEMANSFISRYTTLMGVIAKKFAKKRQRGKMDEEEVDSNIDEVPVKKFKKPMDE